MSWLDIAFVALAVGVSPLYSLWGYRKLEQEIAAGNEVAKVREYVESIVLTWLFGLGAVAIWLWQGRPLAGLGLAMPRLLTSIPALVLAVAIIGFLVAQLRRVRRADRPLVGAEQIDSVRAMLPESDREMRYFYGAALSAGVFEEILYRGYLIAVFGTLMPRWAAVIVAALAFAWGHIYQGWANLPRIFLSALVAAGLYLWTGSLLLPIVLHAFVDINSALTARAILRNPALRAEPRG